MCSFKRNYWKQTIPLFILFTTMGCEQGIHPSNLSLVSDIYQEVPMTEGAQQIALHSSDETTSQFEEGSLTKMMSLPNDGDVESQIWVIDTGNSDSILIENDGCFALIDAGNTDDDQLIYEFLVSKGVNTLDYFIVTHFEADHLGAADTILRHFNVKTMLVANDQVDTKVYAEFTDALNEAQLSAHTPSEGIEMPFGKGSLTFYNTQGERGETHANSLITFYQNGEDKLLFMGDAPHQVESTLRLDTIDFLKVGNHGDLMSSSETFLRQMNPQMVALTVGIGNSYGHPHAEVMNRLEHLNIPVYRTDETGDLCFISTGNDVYSLSEAGSYRSGEALTPTTTESSLSSFSTSEN